MITLLNISFHFDLFPLMIVIAIAWLAPVLLSLLKLGKIPTVIAEIVLGYIIGYFLMDDFSIESIKILDFLALVGFLFLMFLSGLEIDTDQIIASLPRKRITTLGFLKNPLLIGITFFAISLILSYISSFALSHLIHIPNIWYFSLIMVTISVGIILPILKNRGEISGHYGQMLIITAAIADIFSIILFSFTAFIIKHGFKIELTYIFVLFFAFYLFSKIGKRIKSTLLFKKIRFRFLHSALQIKVRGTVLIITVFVVIAQLIGEEEILLGAFLSGILVSGFLHKGRSLLILKMDGIGFGFFIPIFFVMIGMKFDMSAFAEFDKSIIWFLLALFIVLFIIKLIPSLLWARLFGYRRALAGGFLMTTQLSLVIAASAIGLEMGIVTEGINTSFILLAIVTTLLAPILYNSLNPKSKIGENKTIIVGGSSTAVLLTRRLHAHGKKSIIIEKNPDRYRTILKKGLPVIHGDGTNKNIYHKLKLTDSNYVILECGDDKQNCSAANLLRDQLQHEKIIVRTKFKHIKKKLQLIDIDTIDERLVLATTLENLILRPSTYHDLIESFDNFIVEEIKVVNIEIVGKQIKELQFHPNTILMMVKSGDKLKIPHGDTYLLNGDILHVFGTTTAINETHKLLHY